MAIDPGLWSQLGLGGGAAAGGIGGAGATAGSVGAAGATTAVGSGTGAVAGSELLGAGAAATNPWSMMAYMALAGLAKNELIDRQNEMKQAKYASITKKYAPWTGNKAEMPTPTNPGGDALQYGMAGLSLGQNMVAQEGQAKLNNAYMGYLDKQAPMNGADGMGAAAKTPSTPYTPYAGKHNPSWSSMLKLGY